MKRAHPEGKKKKKRKHTQKNSFGQITKAMEKHARIFVMEAMRWCQPNISQNKSTSMQAMLLKSEQT